MKSIIEAATRVVAEMGTPGCVWYETMEEEDPNMLTALIDLTEALKNYNKDSQ